MSAQAPVGKRTSYVARLLLMMWSRVYAYVCESSAETAPVYSGFSTLRIAKNITKKIVM